MVACAAAPPALLQDAVEPGLPGRGIGRQGTRQPRRRSAARPRRSACRPPSAPGCPARAAPAGDSAAEPPPSASSAPKRLQTTRSGARRPRCIAEHPLRLREAVPDRPGTMRPANQRLGHQVLPAGVDIGQHHRRQAASAGARCCITGPAPRPAPRWRAANAASCASTSMRPSCAIAATGGRSSGASGWVIWISGPKPGMVAPVDGEPAAPGAGLRLERCTRRELPSRTGRWLDRARTGEQHPMPGPRRPRPAGVLVRRATGSRCVGDGGGPCRP